MNAADAAAVGNFLAACRGVHDADPETWHREMLRAPAPRSARCEFCGRSWAEIDAELQRDAT